MKRISLLLLSLLLFSLKLTFAQGRAIEGFVYIDQKEPAEMALVALHSDSITSHPTLVTYTDKSGYYHINLNPPFPKQYLLEVRYVGYNATTTEIEGENIQGTGRYDFNLETTAPAAQLQEVVVTAKQKMGIDRKS